jgi:ribosome-associated protein
VNAIELAQNLASALDAKRAVDVRVLDLAGLRSFTDCFVIASATSQRHAQTLADAVIEAGRALGQRPLGVEGLTLGRWVLIDLGDVIVHFFSEDAREFYGLERLWGDAEAVELRAAGGAS